MLHAYQAPRTLPDGSIAWVEAPVRPMGAAAAPRAPDGWTGGGAGGGGLFESHTRRRTSFASPESVVAGEMARAPGLVRDRTGAPKSATGQAIVAWLVERRSLDEAAAKAYAGRMVAGGVLVPLDAGGKPVAPQPGAFVAAGNLFRVVVPPPPQK